MENPKRREKPKKAFTNIQILLGDFTAKGTLTQVSTLVVLSSGKAIVSLQVSPDTMKRKNFELIQKLVTNQSGQFQE